MVSLVKKIKGRKAYYYAVRSARIKGKPRITWQKYLGSLEAIIERHEKTLAPIPTETVLFEAGGVVALWKIAERLGLIDLINEQVPKREQGPSIGHYIVLAALNRALGPTSKSQIGDWYHDTVLQRLWNFPLDMFSSQRFWDHMHMLSEESIQRIQDQLAERTRKIFKIDTQPLLFDSTNFFTFINTHNHRNSIAQRGRNKQKRTDLLQVNLALLATRDFQIPLFHQTYRGDIPDVKSFPEVACELLQRHTAIFGNLDEATLVFDKGSLSENAMEKLLYAGVYFVAGARRDVAPEVLAAPLDQFQPLPLYPGTRVYETTIELCGKKCKAVAVYSESFFTEQLASLTSMMVKCQDKLKELQTNLLSWRASKIKSGNKRRGVRPTIASVRARIKEILSPQMREVFIVSVEKIDGLPYLRYNVNREGVDKLLSERLGRTLLITNRKHWLPPEIVSAYRDLSNIEEAFKYMKNRDYLRWQPAFHWTDQKLQVHTFYCVLALLLATLARKMACEAGHTISMPLLLDELSAIKEVALLYPSGKGKVKAQFTVNKMTPRQKKLAELFEVGEVLTGG
jgi:transposase